MDFVHDARVEISEIDQAEDVPFFAAAEDGYADAPLIGVTTSEVRLAKTVDPIPRSDPPRTEMALGLTYMKAIELAGGLPVVVPPLPGPAAGRLLDGLAGICLSGGPDLHPSAYGRDAHPELGPTWQELDRTELEMATAADERGLPVLAICRGAQVLNVARGGTLFQHVPDQFGDRIVHRQRGIGPRPSHRIEIDPDSRLARAVGRTSIDVNSFHHQAPDRIGRDLKPVAWAPDGLIEALEGPGERFVIGVQWHAEALAERREDAGLFRAFVEAARGAKVGAAV
jgi:putative glutamine amidotransferase